VTQLWTKNRVRLEVNKPKSPAKITIAIMDLQLLAIYTSHRLSTLAFNNYIKGSNDSSIVQSVETNRLCYRIGFYACNFLDEILWLENN